MVGCAAAPPAPDAADLDRALADYHADRYALAGKQAERIEAGGRGELRGRAAYLGGLCAYRLGDLDEAGADLAVAVETAPPPVAAQARAALGIVRLEQGRPAEAATHLATASAALSGEDARQAAAWAAVAYERAGDEPAAARWDARAGGAPARGSAFTLQVGAFRERPRAERAAREAAEVAEDHGYTPVRIVPRRDDRGSVLYLVQLGAFDTRTAAMDARRRLGNLRYIVAAERNADTLHR